MELFARQIQRTPAISDSCAEPADLGKLERLHTEARDNSITEFKERGDISEVQKRKILGENAKRFFALSTR